MFKLVNSKDAGFEVKGEGAILECLDYPSNMNMQEASERLEAEKFLLGNMDSYHIIEVEDDEE